MSCWSTAEFECSILQAERDPVVGLGGRVPIWKPVSLWANVDGGGFDANSESAFELQRQGRTIVKAPASSEDWSYQSGLEFQLTRWYGPSQAAVSQVQFCFGRFYQ